MRNSNDIYDEWLVLRCQGGDEAALATLVKRWQPRLLRFATGILGNTSAAEDAVQSSWLVVVRRINSVNDPGALRPWLFRIVANKCTDFIRQQASQRKKESLSETDQIPDPSPEIHGVEEEQAERVKQLRVAMKKLEDSSREVLRLHYLDHLSIEQISQRLSVPAGTVKSRLYHARQKLKRTLEGENDG